MKDKSLKDERPAWIDEMHQDKTAWQIFDPDRNRLKLCYCDTQKEAIKKAISYGMVPRSTMHVIPMRGAYRTSVMDEEQFQKFLQMIKN